jgi:hypothetical protein
MRARDASIAALVCCVIWAFCSVLPTGITTCIGLPFAVLGFGLAVWALSKNRTTPEPRVGVFAGVALMFGTIGCAWQLVVLTIFGALMGGVLAGVFQVLQATPTP